MLAWRHRIGDKYQEHIKLSQEQGKLTKTLQQAPKIPEGYELYLQAFHDCSPSRQMGMATGPIPISEIKAYLELMGVTDAEDRQDYLRFIRALDDEYLKLTRKKP